MSNSLNTLTDEQLVKRLIELATDAYTTVEQEEFIDVRNEVLFRMSYFKSLFK